MVTISPEPTDNQTDPAPRLTSRQRMELAQAIQAHTGHGAPRGEYDLSSTSNPVERLVGRWLTELVMRVEAVLASPDDTQWWEVEPYLDPANDEEVVEVQVVTVDRVRAALADTPPEREWSDGGVPS